VTPGIGSVIDNASYDEGAVPLAHAPLGANTCVPGQTSRFRRSKSNVDQLTVITWLAMWLSRRRNYEEGGSTGKSPDRARTRSGLLLTEAANS